MSDAFLILSMFHTFLLPVFSIWHSQACLSLSSLVHPFVCSLSKLRVWSPSVVQDQAESLFAS